MADLGGHILAVEDHVLQAILSIAHLDMDLGQQGDDRLVITGMDALFLHIAADGAVDSTSIHIEDVQLCRHCLGEGAFTCTAGAVNGHRKNILAHFHSLSFLCGGHACQMARCPRDL